MVAFTGRFVAVVTARETRFGLTARKTLIMPGSVRYGIDLAGCGASISPGTRRPAPSA